MTKPAIKLTKEKAIEMLELLSDGRSLRSVCKDYNIAIGHMWNYIHRNEDLIALYKGMREVQNHTLVDGIIDLTEEEPQRDSFGKIDPAWVALQRLKIDARKWTASKILHKEYGDKIQQEISGPGGNAIPVNVQVEFVKAK